jgi:ribonucleotide reductase beta subunit family protein with ferritin-like domain
MEITYIRFNVNVELHVIVSATIYRNEKKNPYISCE